MSDGLIPEPDVRCLGSLENFSSILSPAFRASTVFVGLAVLMSILCLVALLLFCFMKDQSVYEICATIQALQGMYCTVVVIQTAQFMLIQRKDFSCKNFFKFFGFKI